ncbi:hypothetical protein [Propionispora hippei]|uniref:Type IV pilus assembly protein PilV n=1 Tax=Propionispora hippei DSM 15287 TaxID=1123003 RepID=A0A1M6AED8_9FIRM|nr:hypothetical protein [Propionispora hippei]SHI34916.1 hypothetical protein SAMN02745170_00133 [Propionispora hippei DSM 15287]
MKIIENQKGFLLLDSLFGVLITSVALISIVSLVTMGVKTYSVNSEQSRAYQIAASYGDALQSLSIANWATLVPSTVTSYQAIDISSSNTVVYNDLANARNSLSSLPGATVSIYGKVSSAANAGNRLAQVKIIVSWSNNTKQVALIKYYIRNNQPSST